MIVEQHISSRWTSDGKGCGSTPVAQRRDERTANPAQRGAACSMAHYVHILFWSSPLLHSIQSRSGYAAARYSLGHSLHSCLLRTAYYPSASVRRGVGYAAMLVVFVLTCVVQPLSAQSEPDVRNFDRTVWESHKSGLDFSPKKKKKKKEETASSNSTSPRSSRNFDWLPNWGGSWFGNDSGVSIFGWLFVILVIGTLIFLIVKAFSGKGIVSNKKVKQMAINYDFEEIEDNLLETDFQRFVRQAEEANDYKAAVRLYFLAILKELSLKNIISWKRDKTNRMYTQEVRSSEYSEAFDEITPLYEEVWYANRIVDARVYKLLEPKFKTLLHKLNPQS